MGLKGTFLQPKSGGRTLEDSERSLLPVLLTMAGLIYQVSIFEGDWVRIAMRPITKVQYHNSWNFLTTHHLHIV
jgi:hypothetical protein